MPRRYSLQMPPGARHWQLSPVDVAAKPVEAAMVEMVMDVLETPGLAAAMKPKKEKKESRTVLRRLWLTLKLALWS